MKIKNTFLLFPVLAMSCSPMSELSNDKSAGFNGGFEQAKNHLPVNWMVYTAITTGTGNFTVNVDTAEKHEGKQSLKFKVVSCSSLGGRFSPGIAQEICITPGLYTVRCYAKSNGAVFRINAGGITATGGNIHELLHETDSIPEWKKFEFPIEIPAAYNTMRIELNVLGAGTLYIDDIRIEPVTSTNDL